MPRGGKRERAGAPRGHRKTTLCKIEAANIREQAEVAELAAEKARSTGKKLAKDVLEEFMLLFAGMAAAHQPLPAGTPILPGRMPDEAKFEKWSRLAVDIAAKLADFQSPRFKAIAVMAPPADNGSRAVEAEVLEINDPQAALRVYLRRIQRAR